MPADTLLDEPMRRRILEEVVSKHLRVFRESGFVSCATRAPRRIYRIEPEPPRSLDAWHEAYTRALGGRVPTGGRA